MDTSVDYAEDGEIVTVTLNQPETHNAFTKLNVVDTLVCAIERLNANPRVRAAILNEAGKAFSSGGNLKRMLDPVAGLVAAMQSLAHATADHKEAVAAFIAKRTPKFGGN